MRRPKNATVAAQDNEQNAQLDNMMIKMSPRDRQSEGLLARAYNSRVENATNRIRLPQERPNWEPSMIAHNTCLTCKSVPEGLGARVARVFEQTACQRICQVETVVIRFTFRIPLGLHPSIHNRFSVFPLRSSLRQRRNLPPSSSFPLSFIFQKTAANMWTILAQGSKHLSVDEELFSEAPTAQSPMNLCLHLLPPDRRHFPSSSGRHAPV